MRIDRSHTPWLVFVLLATAVVAGCYVANFHPDRLPFRVPLPALLGPVPPIRRSAGGTPLGLLYGTIAFLIFLFASALGIRKKRRLWRIVRVEWWLKAHLWLTVLTLPLVLFHCGFRGGGAHTQWLLALYGLVMASGLLGATLQHFLPRRMKERLPREVVFEEIPHLQEELRKSAQKFRASLTERGGQAEGAGDRDSAQVVLQTLDDQCLPYLSATRGARHRLSDEAASLDIFRVIRLNVSDRWRPDVDRMESWCAQRRMMDLQTRFHHWLHGWLVVHVPASFALLVFTAWHGWTAVRFLVFQP